MLQRIRKICGLCSRSGQWELALHEASWQPWTRHGWWKAGRRERLLSRCWQKGKKFILQLLTCVAQFTRIFSIGSMDVFFFVFFSINTKDSSCIILHTCEKLPLIGSNATSTKACNLVFPNTARENLLGIPSQKATLEWWSLTQNSCYTISI